MKLMKLTMALLLGLFVASSAMAEVLWSEDFESYEVGTELVGTAEGWHFSNEANTGTSTIVQDGDAKVLKLSKVEGQDAKAYDMIFTPLVAIGTENKGRELTKFSFRLRPGSGTDLFALFNDKSETVDDRFFYLIFNVNSGECSSSPGGLKFENVSTNSYSDCWILWDAMNSKVVAGCVNGVTNECSITCSGASDNARIRLSTQYESMNTYQETYYDSILIETVPRSATPSIYAPEMLYIPLGETELQTTIYNAGPDAEITYTISSSAPWLTINPTSGTLVDKKDVYFQCNPDYDRGCYEAKVVFDGGQYGSCTMVLIWQNGFIYQSHFGDMEDGDILPQDSRWVSIYGRGWENEQYSIVAGGAPGNEKCLKIDQVGDYGGTHTTFANTAGLGAKYNLKISFDYKTDDAVSTTYLGSNDGAGGEFTFTDKDGALHFRSNGANFDFPVDYPDYEGKWIHVSFTVNTLANNYQILEMQLGDEVVVTNLATSSREDGAYPRLRLFCWGGQHMYVDNVSCEAVEREVGGPELEVTGGGVVYATSDPTTTMNVFNLGNGELTFEATVEDGSGWLSIREAEGADSYSGTITDVGSVTLNLDVDREALGLEYGRGKVKVTGSDGSTKYARVTAQGHTEDGYVFYASDFETTDLGTINVVDPAWLNPNAKVIIDDDNRCMSVQGAGQLHCKVKVPDGLFDDYNFRTSCRVKCVGAAFPQLTFGTELGRRQGEYTLNCNPDEGAVFRPQDTEDPECITNRAPMNAWFDLSYTYNSDPLNRKLLAVTFDGCEYEFDDMWINTVSGDYGYFDEFRFYIWSDNDPYLIDDFRIEAIKKPNVAPSMSVSVPGNPISYTEKTANILVRNDGGNSFTFVAEVVEGAEYISVNTDTNTVKGTFTLPVTIDRSKMGFGFYRPVIRITPDIAGQAPVDVNLAIQSGSPEEGYVIYQSDFASLAPTVVTEEEVIGELSEQDTCWDRCTKHNSAIIVADPAGSEKNVACIVNANDWSSYTGYQLGLNIPADAAENFDVIFAMDMYIPDTYVDREGEEHPNANFFVSQKDDNRQCEAQLFLNTEKTDSPVELYLMDITSREEWYERTSAENIPVLPNTWFPFYMRFSTHVVDFDHKTLYAVNFGENEYQMEGDDSTLTYPGGISEAVFNNEAINRLKFWSYCDDAEICIDNVRILLVPKGLPEPALFGLLALVALAFARKQR